MQIKERQIVYSGEYNPELSSCAFPSLCLLRDGRIFASFKGAETKGPYNKTDKVVVCISSDCGKTWSTLERVQVETFRWYINRDSVPIIKLAKSTDGAKTWQDALTVFDYGENTKGKKNGGMNDVWSEMAAFSVGHPYIKSIPNGELWVYFYSGPSTHRTDFHIVKIEL